MSKAPERPAAGVLTPAEINSYWNKVAGHYSNWLIDDPGGELGRSPAEINAWRLVWRRVLGPPPLRVLDVGTGTGTVSLLLAGLSVTFQQGLADQLPYPDDAFDAIVSRALSWTLPEPETAVREWRRCVRPIGRIAAINLRYDGASPLVWLHRLVNDAARRGQPGGYQSDPERTAQLPLWKAHPEAFRNVFCRAGLEQILIEDLRGTDALESRRRPRRTEPWIPHFLIEGTVPASEETTNDRPG